MDKISATRRSQNMARIKSKGMAPELAVRRIVHQLGYRFRLHGSELPGKPDLVFAKRKRVIFVHGCFWHQHPDPTCKDSRVPKTRQEYWVPKLTSNVVRDKQHVTQLEATGWAVLIVWECETADRAALQRSIVNFLGPTRL